MRALLDEIWAAALKQARNERAALQAAIEQEGANFKLTAADWRYYAERARKERYDLDQAEVAPYFQLDNMIAAAFHVSERLFGLRFVERRGLDLYHPDVRAFEVVNERGEHVALFLGDDFARPSSSARPLDVGVSRPGKTCRRYSSHRRQCDELRERRGRRAAIDQPRRTRTHCSTNLATRCMACCPTLLTRASRARMSRAILLSFPRSFTSIGRRQPSVLRRFALHAQTGEALPEDMLTRILAARNFNQGFATVESAPRPSSTSICMSAIKRAR